MTSKSVVRLLAVALLAIVTASGCKNGITGPSSPPVNQTTVVPQAVTLRAGDSIVFELQGENLEGKSFTWSVSGSFGKAEFTREIIKPFGFRIEILQVLQPGSTFTVEASYDAFKTVSSRSTVTVQ